MERDNGVDMEAFPGERKLEDGFGGNRRKGEGRVGNERSRDEKTARIQNLKNINRTLNPSLPPSEIPKKKEKKKKSQNSNNYYILCQSANLPK